LLNKSSCYGNFFTFTFRLFFFTEVDNASKIDGLGVRRGQNVG
jgi:hypothetical protein